MKLINDTIKVDQKDLQIFLELLSAFAGEQKSPFLVDASQTLRDLLFAEDDLKSDFEKWSNGQIKFK